MNKFKRKVLLYKFFGSEQYIIKTYCLLTLILYTFLASYSIKYNLNLINNVYSSDIATVSGILIGLLSTAFGVIISSNTYMSRKLTESSSIRVVYKVNFSTIFSFIISLLIYIFKTFFILNNSNGSISVLTIDKNIFILILHLGLFSFIFGLTLLLVNLYFLKHIFLPKIKN